MILSPRGPPAVISLDKGRSVREPITPGQPIRSTGRKVNFHNEARAAFEAASLETRSHANAVFELLSHGFQVTWFREVERRVWQSVIKPTAALGENFGLREECFVLGNAYETDFHQATLRHEPPPELLERLDPRIRFIASEAPMVDIWSSAWAQKHHATVVIVKTRPLGAEGRTAEALYKLLSSSLWRRDLFAGAEPVRLPSDFYGRELAVGELFAHVASGTPVAVFGLRKIGKSSLLGRVEDLLRDDTSAVTATAFLSANTARIKSGRWWNLAAEVVAAWQTQLQRAAEKSGSKLRPKADRTSELVRKNIVDAFQLATAFDRDIQDLLKTARRLQAELGRDSTRLVLFLDECDHVYPHLHDSNHWKTDFFVFWNTIQATKRGLERPAELVYVLGGVNPSGVESGSLLDLPNPLFETQKLYLSPMTLEDAGTLLRGLGSRMGLTFDEAAVSAAFALVGGHPLLLRKLGSALHEECGTRAARTAVSDGLVRRTFSKRKREFYNQIQWILEHLAKVAPDEEKLLRDICGSGAAYASLWGENGFRETYAHHLEKYGLLRFENDLPMLAFALVKEALQRPVASELAEQKKILKEVVESIEVAARIRLRTDLERTRTPLEAVQAIVNAIPSDAKNRAMGRQDLLDLGEAAGVEAVLQALNWGDYEILFARYFDEFEWFGGVMEKAERLANLKEVFKDAHLIRHNNDHELRGAIQAGGFAAFYAKFSAIRDMVGG